MNENLMKIISTKERNRSPLLYQIKTLRSMTVISDFVIKNCQAEFKEFGCNRR